MKEVECEAGSQNRERGNEGKAPGHCAVCEWQCHWLVKWENKLNVTASREIVQKMKTRWGSCNPESGIIRLNLELAKKPSGCLECIVVHELVHLID